MASVINAIYRRHGERQKILVDPWFLFIFFNWNWNKKLWLAYVDIMIYQYPRLPQMAIFTSNFGQCLDTPNTYLRGFRSRAFLSVRPYVCLCLYVRMYEYVGLQIKLNYRTPHMIIYGSPSELEVNRKWVGSGMRGIFKRRVLVPAIFWFLYGPQLKRPRKRDQDMLTRVFSNVFFQ